MALAAPFFVLKFFERDSGYQEEKFNCYVFGYSVIISTDIKKKLVNAMKQAVTLYLHSIGCCKENSRMLFSERMFDTNI